MTDKMGAPVEQEPDSARAGAWAGCTVHDYAYDWQIRSESPERRQATLQRIRQDLADRALAHLQSGEDKVLVLATPPGTGKSTAVARLGEPGGRFGMNLAWIAERHDMAQQVTALARYNHIQRCTHENCPEGYQTHAALLDRGLPTLWFHQQHATPCAYVRQFHQETSAFYQLAHVRTAHPAKHPDGIVIDELNLEAWLEPYAVTRPHILEARAAYTSESPAWRLLSAALEVMHQATFVQQECSGHSLFTALENQVGGGLLEVLEALRGEPNATILYPQPRLPLTAADAAEHLGEQPVRVLAHLWHGLAEEMEHYQLGEAVWNSRLRVGLGQHKKDDWVLYITTPRTFKVADDTQLPPRIVLDGTVDLDVLQRLLGNVSLASIVVRVPEDLPPPPQMRHIAVRLQTRRGGVKRYNASSLTGHAPRQAAERGRLIAEVQEVLGHLDSDGASRAAGKVGLITFKPIESEVREALGVPERLSGHFWGVRGSNRFAGCELLLVVGRPRLPAEQVVRMANVLYADDDNTPLDTEQYTASDGTHHFRDARLEQLDTFLTRAELTQCAHRNRPLIFDHRTVVTFCDEPIDFLPITTEVQQLPRSLHTGERGQGGAVSAEEKLEHAATVLQEREQNQTVVSLQTTLKELYGKGLSAQKVTRWHRAHPQPPPRFPHAA
jgi:hypothetical protein